MKARVIVALLAAVCVALSPPVSAQWPSHPTRGVPKTADGKPDLDAAPPRTADGRIDLSGLWRGAAAAAGRGGGAAPASPIPIAPFRDIGTVFEGGLPLTPFGASLHLAMPRRPECF